jgi:mycothiol synthase
MSRTATPTARRSASGFLGPIGTAPGVQLRPYRGAGDLPGMADASQAVHQAAGAAGRVDLDEVRLQYANLVNCDPDRDIVVLEAGGRTIGYGRVSWADLLEGWRDYELIAVVDPEMAGGGLEAVLVAWADSRRHEIAAGHGLEGPRRRLSAYSFDREVGFAAAVAAAGYEPGRRFFEMERPDLEAIEPRPLPAGIEIRPVGPEAVRPLWDAMVEAFRDHNGEAPATESDWIRFSEHPRLDPSMWVVAFDADEIAGAVLNSIDPATRTQHDTPGWLDEVFVRRPWRRRGLGRAMTARSLEMLRDRGATRAVLGVDGANPNQAMTLYESEGFRIITSGTFWLKPIATGEELR